MGGTFMRMSTLQNNWARLSLVGVALLIAGIAIGGAFLLARRNQPAHTAELERYAREIIKHCSSTNHRPSCYDKEIPKLLGPLSFEDTFRLTRIIQEKDGNYWYCHVLGHNLAAGETAKDPAQWKNIVARCPSGMCSNGCIHGAFQERFRAESLPNATIAELTEMFARTCAPRSGWNPTGLEQATCYHALGHLAMYATAADISKSARLCDAVLTADGAKQFLQICYDGVFMQIFQPLEPEDEALVKDIRPAAKTVHDFCWRFTGRERESCWSESWPLARDEVMTPDGLVRFCNTTKTVEGENRCYSALFYVLMAQFNFNLDAMKTLCAGLPQERRGQCVANAASRLIETDARLIDQSVRLCRWGESIGVADACWEELLIYSTYNFHKGSEPYYRLCNTLPEPWKARCLAKP